MADKSNGLNIKWDYLEWFNSRHDVPPFTKKELFQRKFDSSNDTILALLQGPKKWICPKGKLGKELK